MATAHVYIPKALLRRREKPLLIWIAPGLLVVLTLLDVTFATLLLMQDEPGAIQVWDRTVPLAVYAALVYPLVLASATLKLAAAYGLWVERLWARPLLTKWTALFSIATVVVFSIALRLPIWALALESGWSWVFLGLSFWYLYRYQPVRNYYGRVEARNRRQYVAD